MIKILLISTLLSLITACSSNPIDAATQRVNLNLQQNFMPYRMVTKQTGHRSTLTTAEWAGVAGKSIVEDNASLKANVFKSLSEKCHYEATQLASTHIIEHHAPVFYEVWVFNDSLSEMDNKTSAISVVVNQPFANSPANIVLYGDCHSKKSAVFYTTQQ